MTSKYPSNEQRGDPHIDRHPDHPEQRDTLTLPAETIERVTDALNASVKRLESAGPAHRGTIEQGRAALRELATVTSFAESLADKQPTEAWHVAAVRMQSKRDDALAQVKALEESRERLTEGLRHARAREVALYECLATAAGALDMVLNSSDLNAALGEVEHALTEARSLLATEPKAEPRFMFTTVGDDPASEGMFAGLSSMVLENNNDPDFCAWLHSAKPGDSYKNGGGAAPMFITWRVS